MGNFSGKENTTIKTPAKLTEKLNIGRGEVPKEAVGVGKNNTKKVRVDLMIEAEAAVKWGNAEPSAKWQSAKEEMGKSKANMENILRFR